MHSIYNFLTGPMVWIAFAVFVLGSLCRLFSIFSLMKKEPASFSYMSFKYGLRSILRWSIPFSTRNMRLQPVMTVVTFLFHYCLFLAPIFLSAHIVLVEQSWNIGWITLPDHIADVMTVIVVIACFYFGYRRMAKREVKFLTTPSDFVILTIVILPFLSGFIAYHQWFNYKFFINLHIASGELMLMAIPFTRLSHMLYAPITRGYIGSEFGGVRFAKDW